MTTQALASRTSGSDPDAAPSPGALPPSATLESFAIWAVKTSFCQYIAGLADGVCTASDDVRLIGAGQYVLPGVLNSTENKVVWQSPASLCFTGHSGLLEIELREPRVELDADSGWLFVASPDSHAAPIPLAKASVIERSTVNLRVELQLTLAGSALFDGHYLPGEALDPILLVTRSPAHP